MWAPRLVAPMLISKTVAAHLRCAAYSSATLRSSDVDKKEYSQPPRTLYSSECQKASGSTPPESPRYTVPHCVSFEHLTMHEAMQWMVVVYLLPWHSARHSLRNRGMVLRCAVSTPRSTQLYLMNTGPV